MRQKLVLLAGLVLLVFLGACARQGYPTGGPKDVTPPQVLGSRPANESRHFDAREFYIQFDEYVVLKNADQNVLVSPPMDPKPEFTTKGKGVLVKINDILQENTTYLFQFKEAIADFTEGNLLPSFEYVFSTGDRMDTLMLGGRVVNARNDKPWKESVTVLAFSTLHSPLSAPYVTRCDKDGNFTFHYIPAGDYRLVALEDKNRNLQVDDGEAVAWDTVTFASHPASDTAAASAPHSPLLRISQLDKRQQRVTASEFAAKGRIRIATLLPMQQPQASGVEAQWHLNATRDTLTGWCLNAETDSAVVVLSDEGLQDTLKLRYSKKGNRGRRRGLQQSADPKTPLVQPLCGGNKAFYDDLRLAFTNPIAKVSDSAVAEILRLKDSTLSRCHVSVDSTGLAGRLETTLRSEEKYKVTLAAGLFTDLYGHLSDSLVFELTPKDYGTLSFKIDNQTGYPLVIEVLDAKDTVVQSSPLSTLHSPLRFVHLAAGDYRLRAVIDRNGDGLWTPGDYSQRRQPEPFVLFDKTLSLREKWEMEEEWTIR